MALYSPFYDDEPGGGPMESFPVGPNTTYPAIPPPGSPLGQPVQAPPVVPAAPPPGGGGNGGGGGGFGALGARPVFNFRDAPEFVPPQFVQPTMADALNEPGYQFRLEGGADALERSAAARGTLRTGGTLKDVLEYGQNFATQEYGNVFNRALQGFDRDYRGAYDAFLPQFDEWKFLSGAEQAAGLAQFAARPHGGGGGGNSFEQDTANAPPPPGAPPFSWKPGTTDPDVLAWLEWQNQQGQGG